MADIMNSSVNRKKHKVKHDEPYATLFFPLPACKQELEAALRGDHYRYIFQTFDNWLRSLAKHENKKSISIEAARDKIHELCDGKLHE